MPPIFHDRSDSQRNPSRAPMRWWGVNTASSAFSTSLFSFSFLSIHFSLIIFHFSFFIFHFSFFVFHFSFFLFYLSHMNIHITLRLPSSISTFCSPALEVKLETPPELFRHRIYLSICFRTINITIISRCLRAHFYKPI